MSDLYVVFDSENHNFLQIANENEMLNLTLANENEVIAYLITEKAKIKLFDKFKNEIKALGFWSRIKFLFGGE